MDENSLQHSLQDEQEGSAFLSYPSGPKTIKSEPPSYWESEHRTFASNFHDNSYTTYTPLETYNPEPHTVPTYMNLTSGINSLSLSPMLVAPPVLSEESVFAPAYSGLHLKQEQPIYFYDEGIGSSNSSAKSTPSPSNEHDQRLSPIQRSSSTGDSDFADPELSPVHVYRPAEEPKRQCVKCGASHSGNRQWIVEPTGHLLCGVCARIPNAAADMPEDQDSRRRRKAPVNGKRAHIICTNCSTTNTSLWRRNPKGEFVCNACGLYEKLHKRLRPLSMKKDTIQQRKRKPRNSEAKKKAVVEAAKSTVKAFNAASAALPPSLALYPNVDDVSHYQHLAHGLIPLPPIANSNNILFGYAHDPAYQMLPSNLHNFSNDSPRVLQTLHHDN